MAGCPGIDGPQGGFGFPPLAPTSTRSALATACAESANVPALRSFSSAFFGSVPNRPIATGWGWRGCAGVDVLAGGCWRALGCGAGRGVLWRGGNGGARADEGRLGYLYMRPRRRSPASQAGRLRCLTTASLCGAPPGHHPPARPSRAPRPAAAAASSSLRAGAAVTGPPSAVLRTAARRDRDVTGPPLHRPPGCCRCSILGGRLGGRPLVATALAAATFRLPVSRHPTRTRLQAPAAVPCAEATDRQCKRKGRLRPPSAAVRDCKVARLVPPEAGRAWGAARPAPCCCTVPPAGDWPGRYKPPTLLARRSFRGPATRYFGHPPPPLWPAAFLHPTRLSLSMHARPCC